MARFGDFVSDKEMNKRVDALDKDPNSKVNQFRKEHGARILKEIEEATKSPLSKARGHLEKETERGKHSPKIEGHSTSQHGGRVEEELKGYTFPRKDGRTKEDIEKVLKRNPDPDRINLSQSFRFKD